jgi:serine/threonine-protein kinase
MPAAAARLLGTTLSERYLVEGVIMESPAEVLYRAVHTQTRQRVVVRVLDVASAAMPDVLARFEREGIAGACINHPNVGVARDLGALPDGSYFLVMEDLIGPTLRQVMTRGGVSLDRALRIVRQIAVALDAAHGMSIIHRALSPESIRLVTMGSETDVVKVVDFGSALLPPALVPSAPQLADRAARVMTAIGVVPQMKAYTAPEILAGWPAGPRSDLFSLGMILFELVAGAPPALVRGQPPPSLSSVRAVPQPLDALVAWMLAEDPNRRVPAAREVIGAIDAVLASPLDAPPAGSVNARTALPVEGTGFVASAGDRQDGPVPPPNVSLSDLPQSIRIGMAGAAAIAVLIFAAVLLRPASVGTTGVQPSPSAGANARSPARAGPAAPTTSPPATAAPPEPASPSEAATERELRARFAKDLMQNRLKDAVATLALLVDANSRAAEEREVRAAVVDLSQRIMLVVGPEPDQMFDLISTRMDTIGADILYELVTTRGGSRAAKRAEELLRDESVRERGTPAMQLAYDFRTAKRCDDKIALFDRAKSEGDGRTLGQLQLLNRSCGRRSGDCCLHNDPKLKETIEAIKARQQ